jgi:RNA polymerase sigma-70 factor (ECF subfamily)
VQGSKEQFLLYRLRVHRDSRAFASLFEEHKGPIFRYLKAKLPTVQDAEDALSTTFLRLWNYVITSPVDHVSSLTFTIAKGVIADFYRHRKVDAPLTNEEGEDLPLAGADDKEAIEIQADASLLKRIIPSLKSEHQDVILLRFVEGLSVKEAARYLQKSESAVRVTLHRAIKELRIKFEHKKCEPPHVSQNSAKPEDRNQWF